MTTWRYETLPDDIRRIVDLAAGAMCLTGPSLHVAMVRQAIFDSAAQTPLIGERRASLLAAVGEIVRDRYRILQLCEVEPSGRA